MSIDFDKFGHCCLCHKNLIVERTIDGKVQRMLSPEYETTKYLLNDGSELTVCLCKPCKINLKPEQESEVMKSVLKGWEMEMEMLPIWTPERKKAYMEEYSKKKIITRSEGLRPNDLKKKLKEHRVKKEK